MRQQIKVSVPSSNREIGRQLPSAAGDNMAWNRRQMVRLFGSLEDISQRGFMSMINRRFSKVLFV